MEQYYRIADLTVKMDITGRAARQAEAYRCEPVSQPDLILSGDPAIFAGHKVDLAPEDVEYVAVATDFCRKLLSHDAMVVHASAVVVDDRAYLFSAASGTGKSTHTQLWMKRFGDRAYILNDDKPVLRQEDGQWYAYGTPWSGKSDLNVNAKVPLAGIAFLERAETNRIEPFSGPMAIHALLEQTFRPLAPAGKLTVMDLCDRLIRNTKIWKLYCNKDPEAAQVAYEAMCEKE